MNEETKLGLLENLFEIEKGILRPETYLVDVEEYDSMTRLSLIVMMEDQFGVKLDGKIIRDFKTIGDILKYMEK